MSDSSILLRHGTVLFHQDDDSIISLHDTDVLIEGNKISQLGQNLNVPPKARAIDCSGKIISPGFIDTHNHLWMTQMRARHAEQTLLEYVYTGNLQSYSCTSDDVYWGQLSGCLSSVDAGTTMVVDHAHLTYSPEHARRGLSATEASGLRCYYCYVPVLRLKEWEPFTMEPELLPSWFFDQMEDLASRQPFGDGRVSLGLGFDLYSLPKNTVVRVFEKARNLGIKLITSHYCNNEIFGTHSIPGLLQEYGLLDSDIIISHATQASEEDGRIMSDAGVYVSVTPESEGQMSLGMPLALRGDVPVALGVDCHFIGPSDMPNQMRLALQLARQNRNQKLLDEGKFPLTNIGSAAEVFNLGTIVGARAVKMESQIGSIAVGKLADIVIFDATSPTMVCAAQQDPVTAIVRHASTRDVHTVIIDGVIRKEDGKLRPVEVKETAAGVDATQLSWDQITTELLRSRKNVVDRIDSLKMDIGKEAVLGLYKVNRSNLVT